MKLNFENLKPSEPAPPEVRALDEAFARERVKHPISASTLRSLMDGYLKGLARRWLR